MNTDNKYLEDENFCLKLELDALSDVLLRNESERMTPNFAIGLIEHDHRERYKLITPYVQNKTVLDIACGAGYGSFHLATEGNPVSVIGGDISNNSIRYASHRYKNEKLSFEIQNAQDIILKKPVDVLVSFETIEHLPEYTLFLESAKKNLIDNGTFIVSTPISKLDIDSKPINRFHVQEWGFNAFHNIISKYFIVDKVYVQLYQNAFENEKIWKQYLVRRNNMSFFKKVKSRLNRVLFNRYDLPELLHDFIGINNYSKIEEYTGQYKAEELGDKYIGYQILICRKK